MLYVHRRRNYSADTAWVLTTNDSITVGGAAGTAMTFTQFRCRRRYFSYLYSYGKRITRLFFRWK
jgi:hypothetical protein